MTFSSFMLYFQILIFSKMFSHSVFSCRRWCIERCWRRSAQPAMFDLRHSRVLLPDLRFAQQEAIASFSHCHCRRLVRIYDSMFWSCTIRASWYRKLNFGFLYLYFTLWYYVDASARINIALESLLFGSFFLFFPSMCSSFHF
jgi:hypothetical protein